MAHAVEAREAKMVAALTQLNSQHAAEVFTLRSAHIEELKVLVSQREEKVTAALQAMKRPFESGKAAIEATHAQIFKDYRENIMKVWAPLEQLQVRDTVNRLQSAFAFGQFVHFLR